MTDLINMTIEEMTELKRHDYIAYLKALKVRHDWLERQRKTDKRLQKNKYDLANRYKRHIIQSYLIRKVIYIDSQTRLTVAYYVNPQNPEKPDLRFHISINYNI